MVKSVFAYARCTAGMYHRANQSVEKNHRGVFGISFREFLTAESMIEFALMLLSLLIDSNSVSLVDVFRFARSVSIFLV